jgi:U3 small nucleolar RNA-associated protein 14
MSELPWSDESITSESSDDSESEATKRRRLGKVKVGAKEKGKGKGKGKGKRAKDDDDDVVDDRAGEPVSHAPFLDAFDSLAADRRMAAGSDSSVDSDSDSDGEDASSFSDEDPAGLEGQGFSAAAEYARAEAMLGSAMDAQSSTVMADMLALLPDDPSLAKLRKNVASAVEETTDSAMPVPSSFSSRRADRVAAYELTSEAISEWEPMVLEARKQRSVKFPLPFQTGSAAADAEAPVAPKRLTDFGTFTGGRQSRLRSALTTALASVELELQQSGANAGVAATVGAEASALVGEEEKHGDDLGGHKLTPEEVRARANDIARQKALAHYRDQKFRHMRKIKSKAYRRIAKASKERDAKKTALGDEALLATLRRTDPEAAALVDEKVAAARARERVTQKHNKEGAGWLRRIIVEAMAEGSGAVRSRADLMDDLAEQDELIARINGGDSAAKALSTDESGAALEDTMGKTGLFAMKFMQNGGKGSREASSAVARKGTVSDGRGLGAAGAYNEAYGVEGEEQAVAGGTKRRARSGDDYDEQEAVEEGRSAAAAAIAASGAPGGRKSFVGQSLRAPRRRVEEEEEEEPQESSPDDADYGSESGSEPTVTLDTPAAPSNPWLLPTGDAGDGTRDTDRREPAEGTSRRARKLARRIGDDVPAASSDGSVAPDTSTLRVSPAAALLLPSHSKSGSRFASASGKSSQAALIDAAFGTATDAAADFAEEKAALIAAAAEEVLDGDAETRAPVRGWGEWAGDAAEARRTKRRLSARERQRASAMERAAARRADAGADHLILGEALAPAQVDRYTVGELPRGYRTKKDFERRFARPIGRQYVSETQYQKRVAPTTRVRPGAIIEPLTPTILEAHKKKGSAGGGASRGGGEKKRRRR